MRRLATIGAVSLIGGPCFGWLASFAITDVGVASLIAMTVSGSFTLLVSAIGLTI